MYGVFVSYHPPAAQFFLLSSLLRTSTPASQSHSRQSSFLIQDPQFRDIILRSTHLRPSQSHCYIDSTYSASRSWRSRSTLSQAPFNFLHRPALCPPSAALLLTQPVRPARIHKLRADRDEQVNLATTSALDLILLVRIYIIGAHLTSLCWTGPGCSPMTQPLLQLAGQSLTATLDIEPN